GSGGQPPAGAAAGSGGTPVGPSATAPAIATTPVSSPSCVVPLPDEALPQATPAANCPAEPATSPPELGRGYITFVEAPGTPRVGVEIADSNSERERGLMYRTSMPEDQGMLFSWADERVRTFWMHNTCLPLDMLFIDKQGFIAGIVEQVPVLNDAPRSVACPVAHVLELNAGYARSHGLKPGTRVTFE
ncbi:MAG TPA: DUF192 domain-containing protein, partial [Polyangiaceae bacterium]|nr:DUF192 domain-containing protein [Polyangiaceae bacterium]